MALIYTILHDVHIRLQLTADITFNSLKLNAYYSTASVI